MKLAVVIFPLKSEIVIIYSPSSEIYVPEIYGDGSFAFFILRGAMFVLIYFVKTSKEQNTKSL